MIATILVDNTAPEGLFSEWGLAVYIEHENRHFLLDSGASSLFAQNAEKLGIDLSRVDYAALSHAHYDHSDGMAAFFAVNDRAMFHLRRGSRENCYALKQGKKEYIGIQKGVLRRYKDRICYVEGLYELCPGVCLLGHSREGLAAVGEKAQMYRQQGLRRVWDDFSHEQSLVFDTPEGLVVFNSCCHAGADCVMEEASAAFGGKKVRAIIGGFHLYASPEDHVRAFAGRLKKAGLEMAWTGHCTGEAAMNILRQELGPQVQSLCTGLRIEL